MSKAIPIKIHWSLYLLFSVTFIDNLLREDFFQAVIRLITLLLVFSSVTLHEYGHILIASIYGVRTSHITLHVFGAFAIMNLNGLNHTKVIAICLAGPCVNFFLAAAYCLFVGYVPTKFEGIDIFFFVNIVLGVFNLLPIYPMDGGRIIRSSFSILIKNKRTVLLTSLAISIATISCLILLALSSGAVMLLFLSCILAFINATEFLELIHNS